MFSLSSSLSCLALSSTRRNYLHQELHRRYLHYYYQQIIASITIVIIILVVIIVAISIVISSTKTSTSSSSFRTCQHHPHHYHHHGPKWHHNQNQIIKLSLLLLSWSLSSPLSWATIVITTKSFLGFLWSNAILSSSSLLLFLTLSFIFIVIVIPSHSFHYQPVPLAPQELLTWNFVSVQACKQLFFQERFSVVMPIDLCGSK